MMMFHDLKGFGTEINNEFKALQAENEDLREQLEADYEQKSAAISANTANISENTSEIEALTTENDGLREQLETDIEQN